jgi:hypothetical protein
MPNGYETMHRLSLKARADMLETVAGYEEQAVEVELAFAVVALDPEDPATLRWLACLCERRVADLEARP